MNKQYDHAKCSTVRELLSRLGDKWTVLVIIMLRDGPMRFSVLKRSVAGISQRMLTLTLRTLERDGLVSRTVHPTVPPAVEYALTDLGHSFAEPIMALGDWVFHHHAEIQSARMIFDDNQAQSTPPARKPQPEQAEQAPIAIGASAIDHG
ncbi:transcriptional regulator, HxlR family [Cohaesibacter sp. ES.047]|uniref:winged helix-turn-helix transcriptional regulator n=1 Tax=Cohaesibacter sp. ES.047 TaxID=1798205 RepID=UPI000BB7DC3D|nr:helix-turn-helix domain-containing protein [Cohaesibacter sp. ES.047]SNY90129.1 transcriptional regulator, HxlR family [Cohaesibacter sp. ES.047]